ncbi:MAG: CpsD/CapB family tyrosine-protein kinase [Clostridia bacterium]|nr:CpsD/CapB family tyrosine-protein kinase [Clostridia bacterium]
MANQKTIKQTQRHNRKSYILNENSKFYVKEAYRAARANISFSLANIEGCKIIAVTSAVAGDGKTTTSVNIAQVISQANNRVLLIDADMRKGSARRHLGLQKTNGLSSILSGMSQMVDEVIIKTPHGFDCMTAGPTPPNPAELLASNVMSELLNLLSQHYDYIVIDTPPIAVVSDALALSKLVSGFIITVSQNESTIDEVYGAIDSLEFSEAKILGFILNKAELGGEGRYSRYSRYSKYGNKYGRYNRYSYKYKYYNYNYNYSDDKN